MAGTIIFWNGVPLFNGGKLAMDLACCCGGPCCPDVVPTTLTGTITDKAGTAVGLPDAISLVYGADPTAPTVWAWGETGVVCTPNGIGSADIRLQCFTVPSTGFRLFGSLGALAPFATAAPDASPTPTCSPFDMTWTVSYNSGPCGAGSYKIRITA